MSYLTVAKEVEVETVIKGSRFIARVLRVASVDEAWTRLEMIRETHSDATHNCWAYLLGDNYRFADDGEPGGTAGRPMLEVLTRRGLDYVLAVVTRYYGGTKLGAGGLVRAYSGTLAKACDAAGVLEVKPRIEAVIQVPFALMDAAHRFLDDFPALHKAEPSFNAEGMSLTVTLDEADLATLTDALTDLTRGEVTVGAVHEPPVPADSTELL